jgi:hypothetical protein
MNPQSTNQSTDPVPRPMGTAKALTFEMIIIGLCVVALIMVFQPFSLTLFTIGCGLVVLGGLLFNLVPLCRADVALASLARSGLIVFVIFLIVTALAIGAAHLFGVYLLAQR